MDDVEGLKLELERTKTELEKCERVAFVANSEAGSLLEENRRYGQQLEKLSRDLADARSVLARLSSYVGVGAGAPETTVDGYERRIKRGIDELCNEQAERAKRAEAALERYQNAERREDWDGVQHSGRLVTWVQLPEGEGT